MVAIEKTAQRMTTDHLTIRREVLAIINKSNKRLTPGELEKKVSGRLLEVEDLMNDFSKFCFTCTWKTFEKDWVGMVLSR